MRSRTPSFALPPRVALYIGRKPATMSMLFGFIAGVATASTLTYNYAEQIKANTAAARQSMALTKATLVSTITPRTYTIVRPVESQTRPMVETMKDLWDDEVVKGATFVLNMDFGSWTRETAAGVWSKLSEAVGK
ncbi:uncharacterized protein V1518DRAFT_416530 [Limtongia smithiae]|uniref:uncharacterized protein n=1 Tax=Limtongia smithiae TaxID=1125753 RepID=UPI0034D01D80